MVKSPICISLIPSLKKTFPIKLGLSKAPDRTDGSQGYLQDPGSSPDALDRIAALENENLNLKSQKEALENELCQVTTELQNLKISQTTPDDLNKIDHPEMEVSEEAARKRLERACKRNSQGTLGLMQFFCRKQFKVPLFQPSIVVKDTFGFWEETLRKTVLCSLPSEVTHRPRTYP